ncbi:hypothetical protein AK812_SmicGene24283 [Symbiodinium microadriaticum]|uniref:C2H2-type domain-containing protein n=1 Tax=Symbiodinium microadriaticum TaxID=2951 RepID=A0A1Q9DEZ4_SYMMI|nr:hypothetical protein AK812_SmicGene24283 [Symbiodinium microadriaticum]
MEISDAAKSGDGTTMNVGIKMTGTFQCPECRQKFDSEKAKQLHWKFIHDPNRHQEEVPSQEEPFVFIWDAADLHFDSAVFRGKGLGLKARIRESLEFVLVIVASPQLLEELPRQFASSAGDRPDKGVRESMCSEHSSLVAPMPMTVSRKMDQLEKLLKELGLSEPRARFLRDMFDLVVATVSDEGDEVSSFGPRMRIMHAGEFRLVAG